MITWKKYYIPNPLLTQVWYIWLIFVSWSVSRNDVCDFWEVVLKEGVYFSASPFFFPLLGRAAVMARFRTAIWEHEKEQTLGG